MISSRPVWPHHFAYALLLFILALTSAFEALENAALRGGVVPAGRDLLPARPLSESLELGYRRECREEGHQESRSTSACERPRRRPASRSDDGPGTPISTTIRPSGTKASCGPRRKMSRGPSSAPRVSPVRYTPSWTDRTLARTASSVLRAAASATTRGSLPCRCHERQRQDDRGEVGEHRDGCLRQAQQQRPATTTGARLPATRQADGSEAAEGDAEADAPATTPAVDSGLPRTSSLKATASGSSRR